MSVSLSQKEWILISTYLDGQLSEKENAQFEARLEIDPQFKQAYREIQYSRQMMRLLPKKKAPHNFTLTPQKVKKSVSQKYFQPALSFVSALAAVAFVILFVSSVILPSLWQAKAAEAPMLAAAPEASIVTSEQFSSESNDTEMDQAIPQESGEILEEFSVGSGGEAADTTEAPLRALMNEPQETPLAKKDLETEVVSSELMMESPEVYAANESLAEEGAASSNQLSATNLWMISLAVIALVSGFLTYILRRR